MLELAPGSVIAAMDTWQGPPSRQEESDKKHLEIKPGN